MEKIYQVRKNGRKYVKHVGKEGQVTEMLGGSKGRKTREKDKDFFRKTGQSFQEHGKRNRTHFKYKGIMGGEGCRGFK